MQTLLKLKRFHRSWWTECIHLVKVNLSDLGSPRWCDTISYKTDRRHQLNSKAEKKEENNWSWNSFSHSPCSWVQCLIPTVTKPEERAINIVVSHPGVEPQCMTLNDCYESQETGYEKVCCLYSKEKKKIYK